MVVNDWWCRLHRNSPYRAQWLNASGNLWQCLRFLVLFGMAGCFFVVYVVILILSFSMKMPCGEIQHRAWQFVTNRTWPVTAVVISSGYTPTPRCPGNGAGRVGKGLQRVSEFHHASKANKACSICQFLGVAIIKPIVYYKTNVRAF